MASSSSACVANLNCCKLSHLAGNCLVIWLMCSLGSLMESFWSPKWDKQSASWFVVPGIYLTVNMYGNVLIRILCNLGVAWLRLLDKIASRGFWSISRIKWLAYKKWWNFSIAQATARDSISIATYPCWVSVRALLAKYKGFWSCNKHAPSPFTLASVCSTVSFLGL